MLLLALGLSCSDSYLYDERRQQKVPADRTVALEGRFCTLGTNDIVRPIKILIAIDASQSMNATDPNGTRARATIELFNNLPNEPDIYVLVMLFAGSTTAYMTKSGLDQFEQLTTYTDVDRQLLISRMLNFVAPPAGSSPNRDATDFVKPLADIYSIISSDITRERLKGNESRARYSVIFLSDGHPTQNQDDDLLCRGTVDRIRQLKDMTEDVRLNTVHVFTPAQPLSTVCDLTGFNPSGGNFCTFPQLPPGACPMLMINQDAERLERMAKLGGGDFRDFRNNEPINFLTFKFGLTRRTWDVKDVVVTNVSAPAGSPIDQADTDGDGLIDSQEADPQLGTDFFEKDTDKDGFSDGVEVYFSNLGADFHPNQRALPDGGGLDPGCPPTLRGADSDCDGLYDCDEQIIGTNPNKVDSDDDGVPDAVEWQVHTQPSAKDLESDPDNDGLPNRQEVRMHQDPLAVDNDKLTNTAYRYWMQADGPVDAEGRQCYRFRVDNILLANTPPDMRDGGTGRGAGYNDLYFSLAMLPSDDPGAHTEVRHWRTSVPRFPVGGIRSPVDGVLQLAPTDLVDRCGPKP